MNFLNSFMVVVWEADPTAFSIGDFEIRWYGVAYFTMFLVGYFLVKNIFEKEGKTEKQLDKLILLLMGAVVIGGRLGHVLFYAPDYYLTSEHLVEILYLRDGGMASHGATFALMLAVVYYMYSERDVHFLWLTDRLLVPIAFGAMLIRLGNLMNHEIIGHPTDMPWGFVFTRRVQDLGMVARHPSQLYEALAYFILIVVFAYLFYGRKIRKPQGLLTGIFLIVLFTARFFIEYTKTEQSHYQNDSLFTVGQWLSIPIVLGCMYLVYAVSQGKFQSSGWGDSSSPKAQES